MCNMSQTLHFFDGIFEIKKAPSPLVKPKGKEPTRSTKDVQYEPDHKKLVKFWGKIPPSYDRSQGRESG